MGAHRSAGPTGREAQTGPRRAASCGTPESETGGKHPHYAWIEDRWATGFFYHKDLVGNGARPEA